MAKVLVVDDDPAQRARWKHMLESDGHTVVVAPDAIQGLIAITRDRPALILSDILMPRMDGFTFIREVKSRPDLRTIPFLFVTSTLVSEDDRQFAQMLGAEAIVARAESDQAQTMINAALKRHQLDDADASPARAFVAPSVVDEDVIELPKKESPAINETTDARAEEWRARVLELENANTRLQQQVELNTVLTGERDTVLRNLITQRAQLEEQLVERGSFSTAMADILRALNSTPDPEPALDQISQHAAALIHASACHIFLFNSETAAFHGAYSSAFDRDKIRAIAFAPDTKRALQSILDQQQPVALCPSLPYLANEILPAQLNARAALVAPIYARNQIFGLLIAGDSAADRVFSETEIQCAAQLVEQAGLALGNAYLLSEARRARAAESGTGEDRVSDAHTVETSEMLRRYRAQIAVLEKISRPIAESLYPQTVLARIVQSAAELVQAETCNLFLFNADTNTFHGVASSSMPVNSIQKLYFSADNNAPLLSMFQNLHTLALNEMDSSAKQIPMLQDAFHAKAALIVPIVARGQVLGAMLCVDSTTLRAYTTEEIDLLTALADQAALWLEAARWYYEANRQNELTDPNRAPLLDQLKETTLALSEPLLAVLDQTNLMAEQSPNAELRLRLKGIETNTRRIVELVDQLRRITQPTAYLDG
ncbi:MAG: GAF domain-containing protein [Chloroflexi bacterium]|nr:GAF domain-containing protein [Chloroflexota bacterium]